jgi:hypothetical protein
MGVFVRFSSLLTMSVFCGSTAFGQGQQPQYSRVACVKVRDGKSADYAAYLRDVVKLQKVRVDSGAMNTYIVGQAVSPQGRSARCDYHLVSTYDGFPPEAASPEQTSADMTKAGLTMGREAMLAKRDELSYLVSMDTWRWQDRVGAPPAKGQYVRVNFNKVGAGNLGEWLHLVGTGWKPLAEASAKELGTGWGSAWLAMPGGSALPYNTMTVDIFPNWAAVGKGIPSRRLWNQVHPESDMASYTNRGATIADRTRIDLLKIVDVITK